MFVVIIFLIYTENHHTVLDLLTAFFNFIISLLNERICFTKELQAASC